MAELVHELNFLEHVRPVRRKLIHLEHHHLTRHFVSNLEKQKASMEVADILRHAVASRSDYYSR